MDMENDGKNVGGKPLEEQYVEMYDNIISNLALVPFGERVRGDAMLHAKGVEKRLFELLGMGTKEFAQSKPSGVSSKRDVALLLLKLVDERRCFCSPPSEGKLLNPEGVVDYTSAMGIVEGLRYYYAAVHQKGSLSREIHNAEQYRKLAYNQEICISVLRALVASRSRDEDKLRRMVANRLEYPIFVEQRMAELANIDLFRVAIDWEDICKGECEPLAQAIAEIAVLMERGNVEWLHPNCEDGQAKTVEGILGQLERGEISSQKAKWQFRNLHKIWEDAKQTEDMNKAAGLILEKLQNKNLPLSAKGALYSILYWARNMVTDVRTLRRMNELGCGIPKEHIELVGKDYSLPKPVCGKRGKNHPGKRNKGLTQGQKRKLRKM